MEWLAEHATDAYFLIGFAAFMLAGLWWIQKQIIFLVGAGVALVGLLVFWLVIRNVPTAATKIEADLKSLAKEVLAKNKDAAEKYVIDDFKYNKKDADKWYKYIEEAIEEHNVDALEVSQFKLKSRTGDEASVDFELHAKSKGKSVWSKECPWKMRRENEVWKVEKVKLSKTDD